MLTIEELLSVLEVFPEPIVLVSADGAIAGVNSTLAQQLGVHRGELTGRPLTGVVVDPMEHVGEFLHRCVRSGQMALGSLTLRSENGPAMAYGANGVVYRSVEGSADCVIVRLTPKRESVAAFITLNEKIHSLSIEIARRKRAEELLRQQQDRKDEFLALLAHELRNPLAPIRNAVQIMRVADGERATTTAARAIVERQLKHLTRLIDDLLDISRITHGKLELRKERTTLEHVIQLAVEIARPQLEGKQHPLKIELPPAAVHLNADPNRLGQVFANLLHNASKYSSASKPIGIRATVEEEEISVRIIDQGVGIPPDMVDRVFDLFVQVHRLEDGTHDGLGIGLTLVRRIVELHGGTVVAASEGDGRGSEITVRLPNATRAEESKVTEPPPQSSPRSPKLRILVADDNRDAAQTLAVLLTFEGHEVQAVHDGLEALQVGEKFEPQLVLLDIGMPLLDGYETARQIRLRPWGEQAHLVALTGWGQEADRKKAIAAGFDEHLVKPAEPEALKTVIERVFSE